MRKTNKVLLFLVVLLLAFSGLVFCGVNSQPKQNLFAAENINGYVVNETAELTYDSKFSGYPYLENLTYCQNDYYNVKDHYFLRTEYQNGLGLCWDFAGLKAIENFVFLNFDEYYNFSETWVGILKKKGNSGYVFGAGGNSYDVTNAIALGGVVLESDLPFETSYNVGDDSYNEYFNFYSNYANKDLISNFAYKIINITSYGYDTTEAKNARNYVKNYLWEYGSFFTLINFNNVCENSIEGEYKNSKYIDIDDNTTTHAVIIIGYDENYECYYDGELTRGAWIAQNTHGDSNKFFYIPYIDLPCRRNLTLISTITYNGYKFDFSLSREENFARYKQNTNAIYVENSNSNYVHIDDVKIPKNIFLYDTSIKNNITYKCNFDVSSAEIKIYKSRIDVTNLFQISKLNGKIEIESQQPGLENGTYKIIIKSGTIEYLKCIVVYSGVDILYIRTSCSGVEKAIYLSFIVDENGKNVFNTFNESILIYFDNFCLIESYKTNNDLHFTKLQKNATESNYAKGNMSIRFRNTGTETKQYTLTFKTIYGYEFDYVFNAYPAISSNLKPTFINYDLSDGTLIDGDYKLSSSTNGETQNKYIALNNPIKTGYRFSGYYSDKNFQNQLPNFDGVWYLSDINDMLYSGKNYINTEFDSSLNKYCRSIFVYAKFEKVDELSHEKYDIQTSIENDHFVYDGQPKVLSLIKITEKSTGYQLKQNFDYEIIYQNNTNAGIANLFINALYPYSGFLEFNFEIFKADNQVGVQIENWTFGDYPNEPVSSSIYGSVNYSYGKDLDEEFTNIIPTNAGDYYLKAYVEESINYNYCEKIVKFKINKRSYDLSYLIFDSKSFVYDGRAKHIDVEGYLPYGVTISYENNDQTQVGSYTVFANFDVSENYVKPESLFATLTIKRSEIFAEDTDAGLKIIVRNKNGIDDDISLRLTKISTYPLYITNSIERGYHVENYYRFSLFQNNFSIDIDSNYKFYVEYETEDEVKFLTLKDYKVENIEFSTNQSNMQIKNEDVNNIIIIKEDIVDNSVSNAVFAAVSIIMAISIPAVIIVVVTINKKRKQLRAY